MSDQLNNEPFDILPELPAYDDHRDLNPRKSFIAAATLGDETGPNGLISVQVPMPRFSSTASLVMLIVCALSLVFLLFITLSLVGTSRPWLDARILILVILVSLSLLLESYVRRRAKRRSRRKTDSIVEETSTRTEVDLIRSLFLQRPLDLTQSPKEFVRKMAAAGRCGMTARVYRRGTVSPVEPLKIVFEPRPLVESDLTFVELETSTCVASTSGQSSENMLEIDGKSMKRFLLRNFKLRGGWIRLVGLVPIVALAAWRAYYFGAITTELLVWVAMYLLMLLLLPVRRGRFRKSSEWLAVPGGLLVRQGELLSTTSTLHIFDRRQSVLLAWRFEKPIWIIIVSDGTRLEATRATERETHLALRAWLSPLEPPRVEQLRDLE